MWLWRVTEIFHRDSGFYGSGYLVADYMVLTALHVVAGESEVPESRRQKGASNSCQVRLMGEADGTEPWRKAKVVWRHQKRDVALIRIASSRQAPLRKAALAPFGSIDRDADDLRCVAVGFPTATEREEYTDAHQIIGTILPAGAIRAGLLNVDVTTAPPVKPDLWKGYSGSAVFCDGYLVGVVKSYPVNFGGKSLRVEPIAPLLEEPGFKEGIFGTSETNVSVFPIRSNAPAKVDSRREREYLDTLIEDLSKRVGVSQYFPLRAMVRSEARRANLKAGLEFGFDRLIAPRPGTSKPERARAKPLQEVLKVGEIYPRCVLLGGSGAGKTTTVRRMALEAAIRRRNEDRTAPFPWVVSLDEWRASETWEQFGRRKWPFAVDPGHLLPTGQVEVFLDGLNEALSVGPERYEELRQWVSGPLGPSRLIVTCRDADYSDEIRLEGLAEIALEPLRDEEVAHFVSGELAADTDGFLAAVEHADLSEMTRNPFNLAALLIVYQANPEYGLPANRGKLALSLTSALWRREELRRTPGWQGYEAMCARVGALALKTYVNERRGSLNPKKAAEALNGLELLHPVMSAGFLEQRGDAVVFGHERYRAFFAARWIEGGGVAQRYGEFMEMSRLVYNGEHWYWKDKVRMRRSSEQVEVLEALLGSAENPDSVATSILAEHPDHVADILLATDEDLGLSEGQLDRIGRALADKVAESRDAEVSYGLSSYDGEIDHLTAIYSAGDARQEYEEKSAKFGAWRRRRLRRR